MSVIEDEDLIEMRCRACGQFLGWRKRSGRFIFWCTEPCAETPMAKYASTQVRDELVTELAWQGIGVMAIADLTGIPYQMVQQTVSRRKIDAGASQQAS
jgi:hypothetical protein